MFCMLTHQCRLIGRVVCVGGDGMFSEIIHGLISRTQCDSGVDQDCSDEPLIPCSLRIGIIPAGECSKSKERCLVKRASLFFLFFLLPHYMEASFNSLPWRHEVCIWLGYVLHHHKFHSCDVHYLENRNRWLWYAGLPKSRPLSSHYTLSHILVQMQGDSMHFVLL